MTSDPTSTPAAGGDAPTAGEARCLREISPSQWRSGIAAAFGTVFFGLNSNVGDHRAALLYAGLLLLPAAVLCWLLPYVKD